jgi:hypothetical protein
LRRCNGSCDRGNMTTVTCEMLEALRLLFAPFLGALQ